MVALFHENDVANMFTNIGGGPIHTDAQFAYFLFKNYGPGEYIVSAFRKGRMGLWNFMKVLCQPDGFMRMPKRETAIDKEKQDLVSEYRKLNRRLTKSGDEQEKEELREEIENITEDKEIVSEIADLDRPIKAGCYPYLASVQPVYKFHEYQLPGDENAVINNATQAQTDDLKLW